VEGAFIAIGHRPNTGFLKGQIELDDHGYIKLKEHTMTNIPGVFACGDVADSRYKLVASSSYISVHSLLRFFPSFL
jgi:thioredoxin reductase (NADPH)